MKRRKIIAIAVGTYTGFFHSNSLNGIIKQANHLGYDVVIFSTFTISDDRTKHQIGEENVYTLLKNDLIEGVIFVGYSFWAVKVREKILDILSQTKNNVVLLDDADNYGYKGILCDDRGTFEKMTDHLIDKHGFRKLYCLTGLKEFEISTIRLNGYFDSLRKHGIEITEECYGYGDFWTMAATELADKIAKNEMERPEAVICGNDKSAVTLVNELMLRGINVPEDIAVVGYDFGEESVNNSPTVTTCTRPTAYMGEQCVCVLHNRITGEVVQPLDESEFSFISGESCGCHKDAEFARRYYEEKNTNENDESMFRVSSMQESLMACETYSELIREIYTKFYLLRGLTAYSLCLNKGWKNFVENDKQYLREGYEEDMNQALVWDGTGVEITDIPFKSAELIPENMLEDKPTAVFINSVHFEDRCLGYEIAKFSCEPYAPGEVYHSWTSGLSLSLEYIRMQERMQLMYNSVFASSVRDAMTGLYNRKGYEIYAEEMFRNSRDTHTLLLVGVADMDGLKFINDNYGHDAGDEAITALARAIQTCCGNGEVCIRSGGDEFYIIGCYDYDPETPKYYRSRIEGYLSRYNSKSVNPYDVGVSVGFFLDYADGHKTLDECVKIADSKMYNDKVSRKKARK